MAILAAPSFLQPADPTAGERSARDASAECRQLDEAWNELRVQEQSLREYEARLRQLQTRIDVSRECAYARTSPTRAGFGPVGSSETSAVAPTDASSEAAWQKFYRAHEILEEEQKALVGERTALRELEAELKMRSEELAACEVQLAEREALLDQATGVAAGNG